MKKWLLIACLFISVSLFAEVKILAFSGSTRPGSYNTKLVKQAAELARQMGAKVTVINLKDYPMPFYDADFEMKQGMPVPAKHLRKLMMESNGVIIASPEYNSSISAVLKNALDWASRSEDGKFSSDAFNGKKFAIMSASPGKGGGARGLVHLRSIINAAGGEVIKKQVTVANADEAFNAKGELINPSTKKDLKSEIQELLEPVKQSKVS